jgi:hypothetical protein
MGLLAPNWSTAATTTSCLWCTTLCMLSVRDKKRRPFPVLNHANTPRIDTQIQTTSSGRPLSDGGLKRRGTGAGQIIPRSQTLASWAILNASGCKLNLLVAFTGESCSTFQFYSKRNDKSWQRLWTFNSHCLTHTGRLLFDLDLIRNFF